MSSVTAVINHARRVKSQRTTEDKLNQLADAIEAFARLVGDTQTTVNDIAYKVRNLSR
jgi:hypothetical protein